MCPTEINKNIMVKINRNKFCLKLNNLFDSPKVIDATVKPITTLIVEISPLMRVGIKLVEMDILCVHVRIYPIRDNTIIITSSMCIFLTFKNFLYSRYIEFRQNT